MKQPDGDDAGSGSGMLVLSGQCRPLRRALRPLVWVILEEVALDAVVEDGRLVARTSARQVAEQLGVNPSTAAEALRVLVRRGLVSLERETGPAGRFGLSAYQLRPPAGLSVVQPRTAEPFMASPALVQPPVEEPAVASPSVEAPHAESSRWEEREPGRPRRPGLVAATGSPSVDSDADSSKGAPGVAPPRRPGRSTPSSGSPGHCPGQTTFDLGVGSS
jgi:DNA-binding transcriptional ArsR family regulator